MSSLEESASPSWFVQILFGRYRDLGAIQWTHLAVLGGVGFTMLNLYLYFLRRKFNHYSRAIKQLPRSTLSISKRAMGRRMYSLLINELCRVDSMFDDPSGSTCSPNGASASGHTHLEPQSNGDVPGCGDEGWGKEGGPADQVHFNTAIAKSYVILEKSALSRRPGLRQRDSRTIREYVFQLRQAFPSLNQSLCEEYLQTYERAVFGNYKFTYQGQPAVPWREE